LGITKTVSGSPFAGWNIRELPERSDGMGNLEERSLSSSSMLLWTILGALASIAGVILTVLFRIKDKLNHKTKESNRQHTDMYPESWTHIIG
jgi:hypothetical protein